MGAAMTPAEELRAAAKILRADAAWPREDLSLAVANLLDRIAWMGEMDSDQLHRVGCDEAIAIARVVLGPSPEQAAELTREEHARTADILRERGER